MLAFEVAPRFARAKAAGHRYLLVCFDSFDRMRGDEDLGAYYVTAESEQEVRERLKGLQLGAWDVRNPADGCEAVIDLRQADVFSEAVCEDPTRWLARHPA